MTRHLLRIVWNRRRRNFLIALEVLLSFLVLVAVATFALQFLQNWRRPLGFSADRVWVVEFRPSSVADEVRAQNEATLERLLAVLADLDPVEAVAASSSGGVPYSGSEWGSSVELEDGRALRYQVGRVTDSFATVMGLRMRAGRWFSREDAGAAVDPVVLNAQLARDIFGDGDPIGRIIPESGRPRPDGRIPPPKRVIGVIDEYRKYGEFSTPYRFLFYRQDFGNAQPGTASEIALRVTPGTTARFEETLTRALRSMAPDWTFEIDTLVAARESYLRRYTVPLLIGSTIATFLLIMVALGLIGVLWQNVTERTREFGLRRAKGASASHVQQQVLLELALLTSMAVGIGLLLVLQLPALPLPPDVWIFTPVVVSAAIAMSITVIYGLALLCAWYPSRLATKIQPAEALHYE